MDELILRALGKWLLLFLVVLPCSAFLLVWTERRLSALVQDRTGPNRARLFGMNFFGLLHPLADAIKLLFKEDLVPRRARGLLFFLAPLFALVPTMCAFMAIPLGPSPGADPLLPVTDGGMGVLFLLAAGSLSLYGHVLGGWASDNRFSRLGALRAAGQMVSCEVGLTLSLAGVFMVYGTIMPQELIARQSETWWSVVPRWGILTQPLGFLLFVGASMAQSRRSPFDLAEADSELGGGCYTEFSGLRFGAFLLSDLLGILLAGAFGALLFLGGWHVPFLEGDAPWMAVPRAGAFLVKTGVLVYLQMLLRWTLPRMRLDQVVSLGWKYLVPFGLANLVVTAVILAALR